VPYSRLNGIYIPYGVLVAGNCPKAQLPGRKWPALPSGDGGRGGGRPLVAY